MEAGRYKVQADLTGFNSVVVPDVELLVGQNRTVPFVLQVATLSETLTVTGETPLVDTRSTQIAGNVDRRQIEDLPISGRNWMELAMLVKGVTANDVGEGRPGASRDGECQVNLDGQQITQQVSPLRMRARVWSTTRCTSGRISCSRSCARCRIGWTGGLAVPTRWPSRHTIVAVSRSTARVVAISCR